MSRRDPKCPATVEEAKARGYCITSRRYCMASRIDREDWKEEMARRHISEKFIEQGRQWVANAMKHGWAGDHYRRIYSNDTITVPASWMPKLGNSMEGPNEFKP